MRPFSVWENLGYLERTLLLSDMKILLVEDDDRIACALAEALSDRHYVVETAADGRSGLDLAEAFDYDLIVLDLMLPELDGIGLCRRLRDRGDRTPILMLTARDSSSDKVIGLDAGADDYVVKPFDLPELLARIRALLRRGSTALAPLLTWEKLQLDPSTLQVRYGEVPLNLTPKEYGLVELFLRNQRRVLTRELILERLWSFEGDIPGEDTIKVHMRRLRQKLRVAGAPNDLIETLYGLGYRLNPNLEPPV
ncbi:Two component Transcriptional regulator Winged helix family protein [Geitlerinema sp. FC II]|nr:Two component Transcriptional regulator Winged helix family protein [Geitlerinema sp. FC II]